MKLVSGFVYMVGLSFVLGFVSTLGLPSTTVGTVRRRRLIAALKFAQGALAVRRELRQVPRQGWQQVDLPEDTESSQDHTDGCIGLLMEVATDLGLTIVKLVRCAKMFKVHETDEAARGRDLPVVPTRSMPRGKARRLEFFRSAYVPISRSEELKRKRTSFREARGLIEEWVAKNVPEDQQGPWLQLVEDFQLVRGEVAEICFEVHALHEAWMAVLLALEENEEERLEPEAAGAWIRRAEKLITKEPLKTRLLFLRETLNELIEANSKPSPATAEA